MKIKLPANAKTCDAENGLNESVIKISGMLGWDIANKLAAENGMSTLDFCKASDIGVYCDHVILDNCCIA